MKEMPNETVELRTAGWELATIREELAAARIERQALREQVGSLAEEIEMLHERMAFVLKADRAVDHRRLDYGWFVERFVRRMREVVSPERSVLVASKGDPALLAFSSARAGHFPQDDSAQYAGCYPGSDVSAIAQLEALRQDGYDMLVLPAFADWWLEHYQGLYRHLTDRYTEIVSDKVCRVFDLGERRRASPGDLSTALEQVLLEACRRLGHEPSVLDWTARAVVANRCPTYSVLATSAESSPYLDQSIDVVVLDGEKIALVGEARRVATAAVVIVATDRVINTEWFVDARPRVAGGDVTVVALADPNTHSGWTLAAQIAGSCSSHVSMHGCDVRHIAALKRAGVVEAVRLHVPDPPDEDIVVCVREGVLLLPGWVNPLLDSFRRFSSVGAVGGRLLDRMGRICHAGGAVLADASVRHVGAGDWKADDPRYTFARPVDFCSSLFMATTRRALDDAGGLDHRLPEDIFQEASFGLRLQERGYSIYYQPECVAVAHRPLPPVFRTPPSADDQRRRRREFADRWKAILPTRPASLEVWGE